MRSPVGAAKTRTAIPAGEDDRLRPRGAAARPLYAAPRHAAPLDAILLHAASLHAAPSHAAPLPEARVGGADPAARDVPGAATAGSGRSRTRRWVPTIVERLWRFPRG